MTVFFFLLLIPALFFVLPIRLRARGGYGEDRDTVCELWIRPWFGLVGIWLSYAAGHLQVGPMVGRWTVWKFSPQKKEVEAEPVEEEEEVEVEEEAEEVEEEGLGERIAGLRERIRRVMFYMRRLKTPMGRFVKRALRGVRFHQLSCNVVFGTSDPATTGRFFGYGMAVSQVVGPRATVYLTPDFERTRLEGEVEVQIRIYLYRLVQAGVWFACCAGLTWLAERRDRKRRAQAAVAARATG